MQRLLSASVLICLGVVSSAAGAQTPPKPEVAAAPKSSATAPKPATGKPAAVTATTASKPADVQLSDEAELARVAGLYEAGKYPECSSEIERLLDPTGRAPLKKPLIIENARVYWSACLLGAGQTAAADAPLRAAIHENPQMKPPDSLVFPQPVIERFLKVRDSLVNEIRAAEQIRIRQAQAEAQRRQQLLEQDRTRMRALEQLASEEVVISKNHRAWAFVPLGVGQFQNRESRLGYTLLVSEALLGGLSYSAVVVQNRLATQAYEARRAGQTVDEATQADNIATWRTVKIGAFWAFAALAVGGVVQAQLEFVPEFRETRKRKLPPALGPAPSPAPKPITISAMPYAERGGGGLAVMGTF